MTGILVGLFKGGVSLWLCGPVFVIPGLLVVGNMSVVNILEVTNPVYENHMIVPAAVDSSSPCYWLPFPLNAQGELHHFALVFLQLNLECHCASLARAQSLPSEKKNTCHQCDNRQNKDSRTVRQSQGFECPWIYSCGKKEIPEIPQTIIPGKSEAVSSDPDPCHYTDRIEQRQGTPDGERPDLLSFVHLSGYLMSPRETNQGFPLQGSGRPLAVMWKNGGLCFDAKERLGNRMRFF